MIKSLTIVFVTARTHPNFGWFYHSLVRETGGDFTNTKVIIVDSIDRELDDWEIKHVTHWVKPKPTIWQGEHRITKEDWWAKSNSLNTAIILCETDFIAFVDDRCILVDGWLNCVKEAMVGEYAVCGSYEKRANMKVENGVITDMGECLGVDVRTQHGAPVPTRDWYGGNFALPLEWCLQVNGFSEDLCDSLGSEDSMFGVTLRNSGLPMKFDSRMRIIEDRTPGISYEGALKRADKNVHLGRLAKSWAIVRAFHGQTTSGNSFDIREHRKRVQNGEVLQSIMPSASHFDFYDNQPISEMT